MTKSVKYCMHPVEDGRCGKPFTTNSIRSYRKYCDEHEITSGVKTRSTNTFSKVQIQEEMREYVLSEMNSRALTRKELNDKITNSQIETNKRINMLHDIVADITNADMEGYTMKKHQAMKEIIEKRIDVLFEKEKVNPINKEDKIMGYIVKLNDRISVLEKDLDRAYIALGKKQKPLKRTNKNKKREEK